MQNTLRYLLAATLLGTIVSAANSQEPAPDEAARLTAVLNDPNASVVAKTIACKEAARNGSEASVAPLASVLSDEKLSHAARIGLLQIPGDAATTALRDALSKAEGDIRIGIIDTLGRRRDPKAVETLAPFLASPEAPVVRATAIALGKIGDKPALDSLQKRFAEAELPVKALLVDGLFACAERLRNSDDPRSAAPIYAMVRTQKELPIACRGGAIRGELLSLPGDSGKTVLEEEMLSPNDADFLAALEAGRDLRQPELTPVFLGLLPKLSASRRILLLDLLDERGDPGAKNAILDSAKNEADDSVRNAAIRALAGHPGDDVIDFLLASAVGDNPVRADSAGDALARMKDANLDGRIVEKLKQTSGKACIPLVRVCSQRKIADSTPVLLPLLNDPEYDVRLAVLNALGNTVSGDTIDVLIERLVRPASKIEFDTVRGSLTTVCHRTVDPDAVAGKLAAVYDNAPPETKTALLELYGALGGKVAIGAIQKAIADPSEPIQDAATRVLGNWPDPDAAPVLLTVLDHPDSQKFYNRALRGYIRIVRQMDTSNEHRFNMCMQAFERAKRDEEKLLLVDALGRIPIPRSLDKLTELIEVPAFTEPACSAALSVGRALVTQQREKVAAVMEKILERTKNEDLKRQATEVRDQAK